MFCVRMQFLSVRIWYLQEMKRWSIVFLFYFSHLSETISSELNKAFQNKKKSINDVIVTSSLPVNVDTTRPHSHFPLVIKMLSPKGKHGYS